MRIIFNYINKLIVSWLQKPIKKYESTSEFKIKDLEEVMQPGDIFLVEGKQRISSAIKYLTQSTWSHAAFYLGKDNDCTEKFGKGSFLIESDLKHGVAVVPLSKYENFNTRICRATGLSDKEMSLVIDYMVSSIGLDYDRKNIIDLLRYLLPEPPVPVRWRRQMIALGSGTPSKVICSTLIAKAFHSVGYPILPIIEKVSNEHQLNKSTRLEKEIYHIRHHSLFVPRDFDLSPFFSTIKPTIEKGFSFKELPIKGIKM
ncbi:MAG: lipo-like protein [Woeseiaceae bacterium]|nr:lipo-like protein [Woeseiaceae bacterium]